MLSYFKSAYSGASLSQLHLGVLPGRCSQQRPGRHGGLDAQLQWLRKGAGAILPSGQPHHGHEPQVATTPARVFGLCRLPQAVPWPTCSSSPTQGSLMGRVRCSFSRRRVRWSEGCWLHPRWRQKSKTNMMKTRAKSPTFLLLRSDKLIR